MNCTVGIVVVDAERQFHQRLNLYNGSLKRKPFVAKSELTQSGYLIIRAVGVDGLQLAHVFDN